MNRAVCTALFIALSLSISCDTLKDVTDDTLHGQNNAIWVESIYFRGFRPSTGEKLTAQHVKRFAERMRKYNIRYAYIFSGPYDSTGHLPAFAFSETAIQSVKEIRKHNPRVTILPWVGGVQNRTVYLGDSTWVKNALSDTKKLIELLDVPGIHIDFEYILPGDRYLDRTIKMGRPGDMEAYGGNVNDFHKRLRALIPGAFVSSVVVSTSPGTKPWKRKTSMSELKTLSQYVNQLSFLFYDTQIDSNDEFKSNCTLLVNDIRSLKNESALNQVQYLIAIGTFVNVPELQKYRNLKVESIPNTLATIREVLSRDSVSTAKNLIDGIALFSDWQTDIEEYEEFDKYWVHR